MRAILSTLCTALLLSSCAGSPDARNKQIEEPLLPIECGSLELMADPIEPGVAVEGTTSGPSLTQASESDFCVMAGAGPEAVFYIETDHKLDLLWEVVPDFDGVAYIRANCGGDEKACTDVDGPLAVETAELRGARAGVWYLFVDGFERVDKGHFSAMLRLREIIGEGEDCDPEVVLDRCEDGFGCNPDSLTCTNEVTCTNSEDDDNDGLIDCEDPDACQTLPVCDPGTGLTGDPCELPSDCAADANDPFCWSEVNYGYPGGFCSEFCDPFANDCGPGGTCVEMNIPSGNGLCMIVCQTDDDCSVGYGCTRPMMSDQSYCLPACDDDGQCPTLGFCNDDLGDCTDVDEECSGDIDDDDDQRFDCADLDCNGDAGCAGIIDGACATATSFVDSIDGDTTGGTQVLAGSCTGFGRAHEAVHTVTVGSPGESGYIVLELDSETDQGIYVRDTCGEMTSQLGCTDVQVGGQTETLAVPVQGDVPTTVVVDGYASTAEAGPYTLTYQYFPIDEAEPNDVVADCATFSVPYQAAVSPSGDNDYIAITLDEPAANLQIEVTGLADECSALMIDSEAELIDPDGLTTLDFNDDLSQSNFCSRVEVDDPVAGTYFVRVSSSQTYAPDGTFPYALEVTIDP